MIKDHKPNFKTNPSYQLTNPTKFEIGRISKHILDKNKLQLNRWKKTKAVTNWFTAITNKNNTAFIQFDITDYYPCIIKYTLDRALELAAQHIPSHKMISGSSSTVTNHPSSMISNHR